jgi:ParB family chromosome partitioning protein
VRETEKLVYRIEHLPVKKHLKRNRDLIRLQEEVSEKLGTQVTIKPGKKNSGNVVIHYSNLDQLDEILARL